MHEFPTRHPEEVGLSTAKLAQVDQVVASIEARYGLLILKDGAIVHETYYAGDRNSTYPIYSLTKGFGASLIGIAQSKGMLHVHDKVVDWLPIHHPDVRQGATIEHVLAMTAAADLPETEYRYTSGPILNSLSNILWLATGQPPARFYEEELAKPLGLTLHWPHTAKGWMQIGNRGPMAVLQANHRDCARLGQLWLDRGLWQGKRLIDESFIDAALSPPFPAANNAYGYLWWLNRDGGIWRDTKTPADTYQGKRIASAPENVFTGQGARGKLIMVVPDHRMVVVSLGETDDEIWPTLDLWAAIETLVA